MEVSVSMNKIPLLILVSVDDWTAKWAIIASNDNKYYRTVATT